MNEPAVIHQAIDGELVIINLDHGVYYSLDASGARIWAALAAGEPVGAVVDSVASDVPADRSEVASAVDGLVAQLCSEGLLIPADDATPSDATASNGYAASGGPAGEEPASFPAPVLQRYDDLQELLLLDPIHAVDESGWPDRPDAS